MSFPADWEPLSAQAAAIALLGASERVGPADGQRLAKIAEYFDEPPVGLAGVQRALFPDPSAEKRGASFRAFASRVNVHLKQLDPPIALESWPIGNGPASEKELRVYAPPDARRRLIEAGAVPGLSESWGYDPALFQAPPIERVPANGDADQVDGRLRDFPGWTALSATERARALGVGVQVEVVRKVHPPPGVIQCLRLVPVGPNGEPVSQFIAGLQGAPAARWVPLVAAAQALIVAQELRALPEAKQVAPSYHQPVFVVLPAVALGCEGCFSVIDAFPHLMDWVVWELEGEGDVASCLRDGDVLEAWRVAVDCSDPHGDEGPVRERLHHRVVRWSDLTSGATSANGWAAKLAPFRRDSHEFTLHMTEVVRPRGGGELGAALGEDGRRWTIYQSGPAEPVPQELQRLLEPVQSGRHRAVLRAPRLRVDAAWLHEVEGVAQSVGYRAERSRQGGRTVLTLICPSQDPTMTTPGTEGVGQAVVSISRTDGRPARLRVVFDDEGGRQRPADADFFGVYPSQGGEASATAEFRAWLTSAVALRGALTRLPEDAARRPTHDAGSYDPAVFGAPPVRDGDSDGLAWLLAWEGEAGAPYAAVLAEYGMGKTFLARMFARRLMENTSRSGAGRVPIYVDLRRCPNRVEGQVPTVQHLLEAVLPGLAQEVLRLVQRGEAVLIFDGFDEKAVFLTPDEGRRLLDHLRAAVGGAGSKVLITFRDHYFPSRAEEESRLADTYRDGGSTEAWRFCRLAPWGWEAVEGHVRRRLGAAQADALLAVVQGRAGLTDLATRPFLLHQILQHGEGLSAMEGRITATTLLDLTVAAWMARDGDKHGVVDDRKVRWMEDLAWRMHNEARAEIGLATGEVDAFVAEVATAEGVVGPVGLEDALGVSPTQNVRTAAFLTRAGDDRWRFAHRAFAEHFLARSIARRMAAEGVSALDVPSLPAEVLFHLIERLKVDAGAADARSAGWRRVYDELRRARPPLRAAQHALLIALRWRELGYSEPPSLMRAQLGAVRFAFFGTLSDVDLQGADLAGASAAHNTFVGCKLGGANLRGADLGETRWERCDLRAAQLATARLERAEFDGCDVAGADLSDACAVGLRVLDVTGEWRCVGADLRASVWVGVDPGWDGAEVAGQIVAGEAPVGEAAWRPTLLWDLQGQTEGSPPAPPVSGARGGLAILRGGALRFSDPLRSVPLRTVFLGGAPILAAHRLPDGDVLALRADGVGARVDADGVVTLAYPPGGSWRPRVAEFCPRGERVAGFVSGEGVEVRDARTLARLHVNVSILGVESMRWSPDGACLAVVGLSHPLISPPLPAA